MCCSLFKFYYYWIHKQKWKHCCKLQLYLVSLTCLRQFYSKYVFQIDIIWQHFVTNTQRRNAEIEVNIYKR